MVEPNEISFEKPYIAHNIEFTRRGFRLHDVEVRQFPAAEELTRDVVQDSQHLLSEARLWDVRALDAVYRQFQEIRLYYAFHDVDIDRYQLGDRYRQVMVSARELEQRKNILAYDTHALVMLRVGKLDVARASLAKAMKLGTLDADLFLHRALLELAEGNRDEARTAFDRALEINPAADPLIVAEIRTVLEGR